MSDYQSEKVDLLRLLQQQQTRRAQSIKKIITTGASSVLKEKMSLSDVEEAIRLSVGSAEISDMEYLMEVIAPAAIQQAGRILSDYKGFTDQYNPDILQVTYLALNRQIKIPGALLSFDDNYRPSFRREEVYGRMDPIATYQGTSRNIGLEWEMNIGSSFTPQANLAAFQDFIKFMYPVYQDSSYNQLGTGTLVAPPVLRIEIQNANEGALGLMQGFNQGLLCIVDSFSYSRLTATGEPNIMRAPSLGDSDASVVRPTHLTISLQLTVLHEEAKVGFVYSKGDAGNSSTTLQFGQGSGFPYGHGTTLDLATPVPATAANDGRTDSDATAIASAIAAGGMLGGTIP
jgi:hypothetical protein